MQLAVEGNFIVQITVIFMQIIKKFSIFLKDEMNRKYLILYVVRTEIDLIWNPKCVILYETQMKLLSRNNRVEVRELFPNSDERIDNIEQELRV